MTPSRSRPFQVTFLALLAAGCGSSTHPPAISVDVSPQVAAIGMGESVQFVATVTNDATGVAWSASAGTIDADGNFTAPSLAASETVTVTATSLKSPARSSSATVNVVAPGEVTATANAQVALYAIEAPADGNVLVQFGSDLNYGLETWARPVPQGGGFVRLFVAGMRESTLYHMRAIVSFDDGTQFVDADKTFTTGAIPLDATPVFTVTSTPGTTPQPGIELVNTLDSTRAQATAIDLEGNVIWYYAVSGAGMAFVQPVKPMANGHFLLVVSPTSDYPLASPTLPPGTISVLREINLAGETVGELSIDELNTRLTTAGFNVPLGIFHHDILPLANGHWIVLANTLVPFTDLPGHPGTIDVLGDVLVDLDPDGIPVWVWNSFDWLDVNRQPLLFPDWTHSNAVVYSPDDGNLLISIRHQNWVVKVDYQNGLGDGHVIWRLGHEGDLALIGGTDPTDWFYAQHAPSFTTPNSTGQFGLVLFDNGNGRVFPPGDPCIGTCFFSTAPVLQIDEQALTATLSTTYAVAPPLSFWGGNAEVLQNGNLHFDATAIPPNGLTSEVHEVSPGGGSENVWQLDVGINAYRAARLPSLYPGVQW